MRLLVIYPYVPYPLDRGAYHRAYHLLRGLAQEATIDLLALAEAGEGTDQKDVFEDVCRSVTIVPFRHPTWEKLVPRRLLNPLPSTIAHWTIPAARSAIERVLSADDYDAVHICDIVLAQFFVKEFPGIPIIVDRTRVDLQYQLMERDRMHFSIKQRFLNLENRVKLRFYEKAVARRCTFQVVCGPDDEAFMREHISQTLPTYIIPNGVDLDYFSAHRSSGSPAASPTLIFCGAMDYNPNIDALRWYFTAIHPSLSRQVPGLKMLVVGKDPVPEVRAYAGIPHVTVTGGVPDVRPYYKQAWLQVVPLRIGGGTRLKIVESLGMGTPVVSTTIGAQGLHLQHGKDILFADAPEDFIRETVQALKDHSRREQLASQGLATVTRRLSWTNLGRQLCRIYASHFPPANAKTLPPRASLVAA